jgi:RNA polymerase sigma-70 factor (ECF subfamily)
MMEPEHLAQLIDRHSAALLLYARQWCSAAEDVVQEAFVKLAAQQKTPNSPAAWLYCVVRNGALSAQRSENRRRTREKRVAKVEANWFVGEHGSLYDGSEVTAALEKLPLDQREVIVAHLWGGLPFHEVGKMIGCSASTAHRRYIAGLELMRERLGVTCPPIKHV